jgi:hypothetical protein
MTTTLLLWFLPPMVLSFFPIVTELITDRS